MVSFSQFSPLRRGRLLVALLVAWGTLGAGHLHAQKGEELVKVRLLAENKAVVPGEAFTVGVAFEMEPHWHIYWRNPGDSGLPPGIDWQLPEGFEVGEIRWPVPQRFEDAGMVTYGYENRVILLMEITPPKEMKPGEKVELKAHVDWLVCSDICLPGEGEVGLTLPVVASDPPPNAESARLMTASWQNLPSPQSDWEITADRLDNGDFQLRLAPKTKASPPEPENVYFFADEGGVVYPNAKQPLVPQAPGYTLTLTPAPSAGAPTRLPGVLVSDTSWVAGQTRSGKWAVAPEVGVTATGNIPGASGLEGQLLSLGPVGWLVLAFLGGLILNAMPCVLPVLSLKVFSLVKHAEQSRRMAAAHGLAYTGGVVLSFLVLAGALLALRAGGEQVGWAFQLQNPTFVTLLTALFFLFALNLFGVFEIGASLVGADTTFSGRGDLLGSFLTGILAAVVGAPCIGPFLGAVTGLAVQLAAPTALLLFAVMGLGLASPFLLLALYPQARIIIPKPGAWMETFKEAMGFLLMAATLYLLWVISTLSGTGGMIGVMQGLLLMGVAAWIYGRWNRLEKGRVTRTAAAMAAAVLLIAGGTAAITEAETGYSEWMADATDRTTAGEPGWRPWSVEEVERARREGRPVFVDFTASWCLICQVNKKTVLHTEAVETAFSEANVLTLQADWTRSNPEITKELEKFGRSGVPLYLLYSPDPQTQPQVLPQTLSQSIVLEALAKLPN